MKVTSNKEIFFGKHNWGIHANEERELPEDADAAKEILSHPSISEVANKKASETKGVKDED